MSFLRIYLITVLISTFLSYTLLQLFPKLAKFPTFYDNFKKGLIEEDIHLKPFLANILFILVFIILNLFWFIAIPISIFGVIKYFKSK